VLTSEKECEGQQQKAYSVNVAKPPQIFITGVKNISLLIQLREEIA
jgi:hypothetical protein